MRRYDRRWRRWEQADVGHDSDDQDTAFLDHDGKPPFEHLHAIRAPSAIGKSRHPSAGLAAASWTDDRHWRRAGGGVGFGSDPGGDRGGGRRYGADDPGGGPDARGLDDGLRTDHYVPQRESGGGSGPRGWSTDGQRGEQDRHGGLPTTAVHLPSHDGVRRDRPGDRDGGGLRRDVDQHPRRWSQGWQPGRQRCLRRSGGLHCRRGDHVRHLYDPRGRTGHRCHHRRHRRADRRGMCRRLRHRRRGRQRAPGGLGLQGDLGSGCRADQAGHLRVHRVGGSGRRGSPDLRRHGLRAARPRSRPERGQRDPLQRRAHQYD